MTDARARAARRASWPAKKTTLDDRSSDDISDQTTASERFAMVWALSVRAWTLSGQPFPSYPRDQMPGLVRRPDGPAK